MKLFKQQCPLLMLYAAGVFYVLAVILFLTAGEYLSMLMMLVLTPVAWSGVRRYFPYLSVWFGYGRVDDKQPEEVQPSPIKVTVYTAAGCLFCPLVKQRLLALQPKMHFELDIVDVTLRPDILLAKGYASVPVVEIGERRLVGNVTSSDLANLISSTSVSLPHVPATA